jgi:hypothetical protein
MSKVLLFAVALLYSTLSFAQDYWRPHTDGARIATDKAVARLAFPTDFKLFDLDLTPLRNEVFRTVGNASVHSTIISLPNADGQIEQFEIKEASNFEPALQAKFPEIRAFSGKGITDKQATLKLSISPQGIQTMVFRTGKENEFIEPYSADHTVYTVFKKQAKTLPWKCTTPEQKLATGIGSQLPDIGARSTGDLKTLRLAQSVTAEYSNYFGATSASQVSLVLAAVNATLTRCNGIYEKDLAIHLNLIAAATNVFYYNASTDPYSVASTGASGSWNSELQSTLTSVIGAANYDIGHLFGASGGGGNAGCIGCICVDNSKGSGFTSPADAIPQGDNFDVDYVVHEVGHQLGANHTFSMSNEGTGVNVEPGSGITIMGYAGITSQDLAPHSIDIYHAASIAQIQSNLSSKTCPVTLSLTGNATPVANAGGNFTIPISTPFALTGSATDANAGDVLTYDWEQNDNASSSQTGTSSVASATKASGPNWISFSPTTSPTRYFPKLATILAGASVSGPLTGGDAGANTEALSSVSRTLHFRLTVRDNAPYSSTSPVTIGQTNFADATVTVSNTSGPFAVTSPNTAVSWAGNSSQSITWSVASTTAAPVSCANVKISISTNGGTTFSTLVASTPNDGTETVTIPNTPTTTARIKVEAVGNIFFDISNTNFTITSGSGCAAPAGLTASAVDTSSATIGWTAVSGAVSYSVDYKAASSATWISVATATTATSVSLTGLTQGTTYDYRVRTNCASGSSSYSAAQFTTISTAPCSAPTGLTSSAVTSTGATVSWTAVSGALSYSVDYKVNSSATWTSAATATTATSVSLSGLTSATLYDWRVRTNCSGGNSTYAAAQFTTLTVTGCSNTLDNSTNGTISGAATIPFNTDVTGLISPAGDVDNYKFVITTRGTITITLGTLPGDYDLKLLNSSGSQVTISEAGGTSSESITRTVAAGTYYAQVYGYSGATSATSCYTLRVQLGTASRETDVVSSAVIFPNPANNVVNINLTGVKGKSDVSVFDVNGRVVLRREVNSANTQLDISALLPGVYIIRIKNGVKEVNMTKIIKQ